MVKAKTKSALGEFRNALQVIEASPAFEKLVLVIIVANCIALTLFNPQDRDCLTSTCQDLQVCEMVFSSFFLLEFTIRLGALGVKGYFSNPWLRLDFIIVLSGIFDFLPGMDSGSTSVLRTLRVLRPLRVVNRFPSLRILVRLLLDIIPMLASVGVLCIFLFAIFGIIGVQLWKDVTFNGCYNSVGELYKPEDGTSYLCSNLPTGQSCSDIAYRRVNLSDGHDVYDLCLNKEPNVHGGAVSFENIFSTFLIIFQVISLEDWSAIMHDLQDGYSFWVWPWFVVLIIIGSWFAVNLALVVIATQFKMTKKREIDAMNRAGNTTSSRRLWEEFVILFVWLITCGSCVIARRKRQNPNGVKDEEDMTAEERHDVQMIREVFDLFDGNRDGTVSVDELKTALAALDNQLSKEELKELCNTIDADGNGYIDFDEFRALMSCETEIIPEPEVGSKVSSDLTPNTTDDGQLRSLKSWKLRTQRLVSTKWFSGVVIGCIFLNTVTMSLEHHGQPDELGVTIETVNSVLAFVFLVEVVLRIFSTGPLDFFLDGYDTIDFVIVVLGVVEVFFTSSHFAVLRAFRLLRLFKLARYMSTIQKQLVVMLRTLDSVVTFLILLFLFVFILAIMGMHLFGGRLGVGGDMAEIPRHNFDGFFISLITVFQVMTTEEWTYVMYDAMLSTTRYASIYFVVLLTFGTHILINLFIAIMVDGFASDPEALERFRRAVMRTRRIMERISSSVMRKTVGVLPEGGIRISINKPDGSGGASKWKWFNRSNRTAPAMIPEDEDSDTDVETDADLVLPASNSIDSIPSSPLTISPDSDLSSIAVWPYAPPKMGFYERLKAACFRLATRPKFNNVMLAIILLNAVTLIVERPSHTYYDTHPMASFSTVAAMMFAVVFTFEAVLKIIAFNLIDGKRAYLRDGWNRVDLVLVIASWCFLAVVFIGSNHSTNIALGKVFRIITTLRPIRIIQKIPSARRTMQTLYVSVRPIGNIFVMGTVFYIIFAIWGVQLFRGKLFYCAEMQSVDAYQAGFGTAPELLANGEPNSPARCNHIGAFFNTSTGSCSIEQYTIVTREDCTVFGGAWENRKYNFDHFVNAVLTLFVVSSLDGWVFIMRTGVDAVGEDLQPIKDYNQSAVVYFISFILIVGYFVISMFVGVIVENFQLGTPSTVSNESARKNAALAEWDFAEMDVPRPAGKFRGRVYDIIEHPKFRAASSFVILLNMVMMASEHHGQTHTMEVFIQYSNLAFTVVYVMEEIAKIIGLGPKHYWQSFWNRAELVITLLSVAGTIFDFIVHSYSEGEIETVDLHLIHVARLFRVISIFKLIKSAPGLASLLLTVKTSTKHVLNLSVLLCVLFFIAASLGMELFGHIKCTAAEPCRGLSNHGDFSTMGLSFLVLFQVATGDNWSGVMEDTLRANPGCDGSFSCVENCCGSRWMSPIYFVLFVVLAQLIMLNVVVAVLMKNLGEAVRQCKLTKFGSHNRRTKKKLKANQVAPLETVTETTVIHIDKADTSAQASPEPASPAPETSSDRRVTKLLLKLQHRTEKISERRRRESGKAGSTAGSSKHRHALKASLHLVMAMIHMMGGSGAEKERRKSGGGCETSSESTNSVGITNPTGNDQVATVAEAPTVTTVMEAPTDSLTVVQM